MRVSDCQDIDVVNSLDGFSTQPRITAPFDGDIDPASVNSDSIYLVDLFASEFEKLLLATLMLPWDS